MTPTPTKAERAAPRFVLRQLAVLVADCEPGVLWQDRARCAGQPTDLFYGWVSEHTMTMCRTCPVRVECLAEALTRPHEQGVWGGLTESERAEVAEMVKEFRR